MSADEVKRTVLAWIAGGRPVRPRGRATAEISGNAVHYRYCSTYAERPTAFKFNINSATLAADYELWICGSAELHYLLPIHVIREMYDDPRAYPDHQHSTRRVVVSVDARSHTVMYGRGGLSRSLAPYHRRQLP